MNVNKVMLVGRLGADPEIRTTQNGQKVARLSVGTSETWKDKSTGEKKSKTEWHTVAVFNDNLVGYIENYGRKGSQVCVEGMLRNRQYQEKYYTEVIIQSFKGSVQIHNTNTGSRVATTKQEKNKDNIDDILGHTPF